MDSATDRRLEAPRQEGSAADRAADSVPASYAERAMNSLMSLHSSLVAEKERTLDLTRRLMEARQGTAELESYVRLLEAEVARLGGPDLRDARDGRGDALGRASERILDALRRAPASPAAPPMAEPAASEAPAPEAEATEPVATEAPVAEPTTPAPARSPVAHPRPTPPPRPGRAQAHRVPRPPRPSRRYRTKITAPAAEARADASAPRSDAPAPHAEATEAPRAPAPRAEATGAPRAAAGAAPAADLADDDGWRQW